jgi:hypothetical protein
MTMSTESRDEKARAEAEEFRTANLPARFSWMFVGALIMGLLATGAVVLAQKTSLIKQLDPIYQFWLFELGTGLAFFLGGFAMALFSAGRTTREPVYAAMLAFVAQTGFLVFSGILVGLNVPFFLLMLAIGGAMAYAGAWFGERLTGEI